MQELNAPTELIEQQNAAAQIPDIQPANEIIVHLFLCCATQWNYAGMAGVRTGLNYQAVDIRARAIPEYRTLDAELIGAVWDGIQLMEYTALSTWANNEAD